MQYSALAQINKSNVTQLQRAWFYPVPGEPDQVVFNPLIVDNVMYVAGVRNVIVALDATTGKELWMSTLRATERGLAYWESKDRSDRRLIVSANNGIREVDARTGRQIMTFGNNGFVDMRIGAPAPQRRSEQQPGAHLRKSHHRRIERRRRLWVPARRHSRVRRADRQARVDVSHNSAARRVRV